jgi:hypothetical protein
MKTNEFAIFNRKPDYPTINHYHKGFFLKLWWRLLFKKVPFTSGEGRCVKCAAGRDSIFHCGNYYCPCNYNEQLTIK